VPQLVDRLKERYGSQALTHRLPGPIEIDFVRSELSLEGESFPLQPVGKVAQEIIVAQGLEQWVKKRLAVAGE